MINEKLFGTEINNSVLLFIIFFNQSRKNHGFSRCSIVSQRIIISKLNSLRKSTFLVSVKSIQYKLLIPLLCK